MFEITGKPFSLHNFQTTGKGLRVRFDWRIDVGFSVVWIRGLVYDRSSNTLILPRRKFGNVTYNVVDTTTEVREVLKLKLIANWDRVWTYATTS